MSSGAASKGGRVNALGCRLKGREGLMPSGDAREGSGRREPKECEEGRVEVLGTFFARAHREDDKQYGACGCGCGGHALRVGR